MIFGYRVEFYLPKTAASAAPPPLPEIVYKVITPPRLARFGRNLVTLSTLITVIWSNSQPEEEFLYGGGLFFQTRSSYISAVN